MLYCVFMCIVESVVIHYTLTYYTNEKKPNKTILLLNNHETYIAVGYKFTRVGKSRNE